MNFKTHREGRGIILTVLIVLVILNLVTALWAGSSSFLFLTVLVASLLLILFILRFFRIPPFVSSHEEESVYSPCYGKVVVVEETTENEYFRDKRIQISIFMSVWDVHINWYPVSGLVKFFKYHPGRYLVARNPKSSGLNERTTVVLETANGKNLLFRQIAGAVARRVVCYATPGEKVKVNDELGFIKFGSRVDVFLPLGSEVLVKPGQKVEGNKDVIALLK